MAERRNATETYVATQTGLLVPKSLYDANTILKADSDDTPVALTMGASTILARLAAGSIVAATPVQIAALLTSKLPGYVWDSASITSDATSTQTVEASATTIINGASVTYDGSQVRIFVSSRGFINSLGGATASSVINVWRDSTDLGRVGTTVATSVVGSEPVLMAVLDTPSAGAHTYSVRMWVTAASTATLRAGAGGAGNSVPAVMWVEKVIV